MVSLDLTGCWKATEMWILLGCQAWLLFREKQVPEAKVHTAKNVKATKYNNSLFEFFIFYISDITLGANLNGRCRVPISYCSITRLNREQVRTRAHSWPVSRKPVDPHAPTHGDAAHAP